MPPVSSPQAAYPEQGNRVDLSKDGPGFLDSEETLPGRGEAWQQRPPHDMLIYDHFGLE